MAIQDSVNRILGSVAAASVGMSKLKSPLPSGAGKVDSADSVASGKELRMAAKARKEAKTKIAAIMSNKEISEKARSRRIGKVLEDFKKEGGGK